jgi:hypothetical protein
VIPEGLRIPEVLRMCVIWDDQSAKEIIEAALERKIWEPFRGLVVLDHKSGIGNIVGAIIFNNYDQHDVHFTCVMSAPISMMDARYVARYVFGRLDCRRCTAVTSERNLAARRALLQLGFRHEGTLRDHFDEADGFVYGLLRSEQKIVRGI